MMGFSKDDRERGVTSGELISCSKEVELEPGWLKKDIAKAAERVAKSCPAPDREGELEYLQRKLECKAALIDGLRRTLDEERATLTTLRRQVETARADALEEAAKIADLSAHYNGHDESRSEVATTIAREIRALNSLKTEG